MEKYFDTKRFVNYMKLSFIENKRQVFVAMSFFILAMFLFYYLSLSNPAFFLAAQIQAKFFLFYFFPFVFSLGRMARENKTAKSIFNTILPVSFFEKWLEKFLLVFVMAAILWIILKVIDYAFLNHIIQKFNDSNYGNIPNPKSFELIGFGPSKTVFYRSSGFDLDFISIVAIAIISYSTLLNSSNFRTSILFLTLLAFFGFGKNWILEAIIKKNISFAENGRIEVYDLDINKFSEVKIPEGLMLIDNILVQFIIPISLVVISLVVTKEKQLSR